MRVGTPLAEGDWGQESVWWQGDWLDAVLRQVRAMKREGEPCPPTVNNPTWLMELCVFLTQSSRAIIKNQGKKRKFAFFII
jgi:hypothetical protein